MVSVITKHSDFQ